MKCCHHLSSSDHKHLSNNQDPTSLTSFHGFASLASINVDTIYAIMKCIIYFHIITDIPSPKSYNLSSSFSFFSHFFLYLYFHVGMRLNQDFELIYIFHHSFIELDFTLFLAFCPHSMWSSKFSYIMLSLLQNNFFLFTFKFHPWYTQVCNNIQYEVYHRLCFHLYLYWTMSVQGVMIKLEDAWPSVRLGWQRME